MSLDLVLHGGLLKTTLHLMPFAQIRWNRDQDSLQVFLSVMRSSTIFGRMRKLMRDVDGTWTPRFR